MRLAGGCEPTAMGRGAAAYCRRFDLSGRSLQSGLRGLAPGALLGQQLICDVVLVDVAHVGDGLAADALGGNLLDIAEPDIRVQPARLRLFPQLPQTARTGVVRCER